MIVPNPKHLFEATSPVLEDHESEIHYQHPTEDIYCNQLGIVFYNEEKYRLLVSNAGIAVKTRENVNVGSKNRIVWECYRNQIYSGAGSPHYFHMNGNVYDFTPDNLKISTELTTRERAAASAARSAFIKESVKYLKALEKKFEKRGIEIHNLYETLNLPTWLINARKRTMDPSLENKPKMAFKGNRCRTTVEDLDIVLSMHQRNYTYKEIADFMNWPSKSRVGKIVRDWKKSENFSPNDGIV